MTSSQRLCFTVLRADRGGGKFRIGNMAPAMDQPPTSPGDAVVRLQAVAVSSRPVNGK